MISLKNTENIFSVLLLFYSKKYHYIPFENEARNVPIAAMMPPSTATGRHPRRSHRDVAMGPEKNIIPYVIEPTHAEMKNEKCYNFSR